MEPLRSRRKAVPAALSMKNHDRFYPAKTIVRNRVSVGTEFDDTDFEDEDSDEESLHQSMQSLAYDSNTTISSPELPSPEDALKKTVNIRLDDSLVRGPSGPHLFRDSLQSRGSSLYEPSTAEIDLYFERSPLQSGFTKSIDTPNRFPFSPNTPNRFPFSPKTPKAFTTVHPDVSQVDEEEIRNWKPSQVAHWLYIAGYNDAVIEKFIINDITGTVLLSLQTDDLKELNISSFGIRHQVMASISHLKSTMHKGGMRPPEPSLSGYGSGSGSSRDSGEYSRGRSPPSRERCSPERAATTQPPYTMTVSPTGEILANRVYDQSGTQILPTESVSIVGIEQLLPKPHSCSKGEACSKYQRRQRQIEKLKAEFPNAMYHDGAMISGNPGNPDTARNMLRPKSESDPEPSVVASSDVLGPGPAPGPRLSEAALNGVQKLDPQETIRNFLSYQHVDNQPRPTVPAITTNHMPFGESFPEYSPPDVSPNNMAANLRTLPKLMIPGSPDTEEMTTAVTTNRSMTPTRELYGSPTATQQYGPFTQANNINIYRQGTPFSEMDVPVTAIPNGPIARDTSASVPPNMQYGQLFPPYRDPIARASSARPRAATTLQRVNEGKPLTPIERPADLVRSPRMNQHGHSVSQSSLASDPDVTHAGYMKKRNKTRLLRHEWQDAHFTLRGTELAMHKDEADAHRISKALDMIDVDEYAVACSSLATSSKLTAAFKRSILRSGNAPSAGHDDAAFAFSLVPASKENERKALFGSKDHKPHHFAVQSREERIDWMRELMLAKALKKGKEAGEEVLVNGNMI